MRTRFAAYVALVVVFVLLAAVSFAGGSGESARGAGEQASIDEGDLTPAGILPAPAPLAGERTAVFAGGCFWCVEEAFEKVPGVREAVSGFAGGTVANPTYSRVLAGGTGHIEVAQVYYDPDVVTYEELLYVFWRNIDPIDEGGQFCDRGEPYRTAVFYQTAEERSAALRSKEELDRSGRFEQPIVTQILALDVLSVDGHNGFWPAEEYHQDYYLRNPVRYRFYKEACGRDRRLEQLWGAEAGAPDYS